MIGKLTNDIFIVLMFLWLDRLRYARIVQIQINSYRRACAKQARMTGGLNGIIYAKIVRAVVILGTAIFMFWQKPIKKEIGLYVEYHSQRHGPYGKDYVRNNLLTFVELNHVRKLEDIRDYMVNKFFLQMKELNDDREWVAYEAVKDLRNFIMYWRKDERIKPLYDRYIKRPEVIADVRLADEIIELREHINKKGKLMPFRKIAEIVKKDLHQVHRMYMIRKRDLNYFGKCAIKK